MKTSHKILIGFVLLYLIGQSITFSIGHSTVMENRQKRKNIQSQKTTVPLHKDFSVLMVEAKGHITLNQSCTSEAEFYGNQHLLNTSLECIVKNDTCFVRAFAPDSVGTRNLIINTPGIRNIHLVENNFFQLRGKFDSLDIHHEKGRLRINRDSQIGYLRLIAKNKTHNDLNGIQNGHFKLDNAKIDLRSKAKGLKIKLRNNSNITIYKSPDQLQLEKDESSKIRIY